MTWAADSVFVAGGDFVSEYWADFQAQAGVTAIVTVSPADPPRYGQPHPWAALWLPVADEAAYTLDQLLLGADFIAAALGLGRKVLLHGPAGVHRTRPLIAAHLLRQGKTLSRVLREMEDKPWLPPYQGSREVLEELAGRLQDVRSATGPGTRGSEGTQATHSPPSPLSPPSP